MLRDLKSLFLGPSLFRLDTVWASKLVPIIYFVGLFVILLLAVSHLFFTFGFGFSQGLWGLLQIAVFGVFYLLVLRVACEMILVFFKSHELATEKLAQSRDDTNLLDDVREALHDLAGDEDAGDEQVASLETVPASEDPEIPPRGPVVKRTARRTPPAKL